MAVNRINEFLEALKVSTDLETLAKTELNYLDGSLTLSSKKRALSRYRNAIRSAYGDHEILKVLKLSKNETNDLNLQNKTQIRATSDNQIALNLEAYLDIALQLLANRTSYTKVAIGIIAVTGRRPVEILKTGSFELISGDWVKFAGQAKKAKISNDLEALPYQIPVLTDSTDILEALTFIRSVKDFSDIDNDILHSKTSKTLNEICKKHFANVLPASSPKLLRKAYSEIASHWFKADTQEKNAFLSDILGHETLDIATSQTYKQFYIDD